MEVRRRIDLALISLLAVMAVVPAQGFPPRGLAVARILAGRQDALEKLVARGGEPTKTLAEELRTQYWPDEKLRAAALEGLTREGLPANLLLAIAEVAAESDERRALPGLIEILIAGKLESGVEVALRDGALGVFHRKSSIFPVVVEAMIARAGETPALARLGQLMLQLVEAARLQPRRLPGVDRREALNGFLRVWNECAENLDAEAVLGLRRQISTLCADVDLPDEASWRRWLAEFDAFNRVKEPPSLTAEDVLRFEREGLRKQLEAMRIARRRDVAQLIELKAKAGEPVVEWLRDGDPEVRATALLAIKSIDSNLQAQARSVWVTALLELFESHRDDPGSWPDLVAATEILGRGIDDALKTRLVKAVFERDGRDDPEILGRQVRLLGRIEAASESGRLEKAFRQAKDDGRSADNAWTEVRRDVIRVVGALRKETELVQAALEDDSVLVRAEAAVVSRSVADQLSGPERTVADRLMDRAVVEPEPAVFTRLLESLLAVARENDQFFTTSTLQSLPRLLGKCDAESTRRVMRLLAALLDHQTGEVKEPDAVSVQAESVLAARLAGEVDETGPAFEALCREPTRRGTALLGRRLEARGDQVLPEAARRLVVEGYSEHPAWLWELASTLAANGGTHVVGDALAFGLAAEAAGAKENADSATEARRREEMLLWRERSENPTQWRDAVVILQAAIEKDPQNLALRRRRSTLLQRLQAAKMSTPGDVEVLDADLSALLGAPLEADPDGKNRQVYLQALMRLRFLAGRFDPCRSAIQALRNDKAGDDVALVQHDRACRALSSRKGAAEVGAEIAALAAPTDAEARRRRLLLRVAAWTWSAPKKNGDLAEELRTFDSIRELPGPLGEWCRAAFPALVAAQAALSEDLKSSEAPGPMPSLAVSPEMSWRAALALLSAEGRTWAEARRIAENLRAAFPQDASLAALSAAPTGQEVEAAALIHQRLVAAWNLRPVPADFVGPFLNEF